MQEYIEKKADKKYDGMRLSPGGLYTSMTLSKRLKEAGAGLVKIYVDKEKKLIKLVPTTEEAGIVVKWQHILARGLWKEMPNGRYLPCKEGDSSGYTDDWTFKLEEK